MENQILAPIELIHPNPFQPRETEDREAVGEIAASIQKNGLMQVPSARQVNGHYELVFGHTRLAAFKLNGESCMPLIIRDLDDLQMFEFGNAENIHRRDLTEIEKAKAMKLYMEKFGKTSVEAGEFFGVSEETVRGTVRLLNLVPEAQKSLKEGKITITTARSLLSMQKIAQPEVIVKTVQQLEKGVNQYGHAEAPDEVIEYSIRRLDETVHMWNDNRDGKPRSTDEYNPPGWLLSMKNFPNKLLSVPHPEDVVIALGVQDNERLCSLADEAFHDLESGDYLTALKKAFAGEEGYEAMIQRLEVLINPPACTACPFYTRINGSHYCGMKTCHTRKTAAWHEQILQQAVKNLGIPLYTKKDGKYQILTYEHEKLFAARNKDLRLVPRSDIRGYHYQHFPGVEHAVFLVVMTGKTLEDKTTAIKEARAVERKTQSAAERHNELVDEHRKLLEWEATLPVKALFEAFNPVALKAMEDAAFDWPADETDAPEGTAPAEGASADMKVDFKRRLIALSMLKEAEDRYTARGNNCESWALWLSDTLVSWGVKPPKGFVKAAQRFDEEIQEAVSTETAKNGRKK